MDMERIIKLSDETLLAAGGEMSDFQYIQELIETKKYFSIFISFFFSRQSYCLDDGFSLKPKEFFSYLNRIVYNRRMKGEFLWNDLIIAGFEDGKPFLGHIDKLGDSFSDCYAATGMGMHIALPILRSQWKKDLSLDEAKLIIETAMRTILFRDARTINKFQFAIATAKGVEITPPTALRTEGMWSTNEKCISDRMQYYV
jgi:20S proteasome subunit beta 7